MRNVVAPKLDFTWQLWPGYTRSRAPGSLEISITLLIKVGAAYTQMFVCS